MNSMVNMWILPIGTVDIADELWEIFKNESYVGINYTFGDETVDYSIFNSEDEIKQHVDEHIEKGSYYPSTIWKFVNVIKPGDLIFMRYGSSKLAGVGVITSDFIPQTKNNQKNDFGYNNIRYVNWLYTPGNIFMGRHFFSRIPLVELSKFSHLWNVLLCALSRSDDGLKENILSFLYNQFLNEFFNSEKGKTYLNNYSNHLETIKNAWIEISDKKSNGEEVPEELWDGLFDCNVQIQKGEEISFKSILDSQNYSDVEINNARDNLFEVIFSILNTSDMTEKKRILNEYSTIDSSEVFDLALISHILHCIDNSFYIIDDSSIFTLNLLISMFSEKTDINSDLTYYFDNNIKFKDFLNKLSQFYFHPSIDIIEFRIFRMFCYWMCDKELGHYAAKRHYDDRKVNKLPTNLLGDIDHNVDSLHLDNTEKNKTFETNLKRNIIYFGAPGTGKSYNLNKDMETLTNDYERVTFHPDYSYANFVGTYKPVPKGESISYEYVPGPFMRSLVKALKNPENPFLLIIEEINRANVAAVFGDVFQLLDRDLNNESRYAIETTEDMRSYLKKELNEDFDKIKIPSNMFIWATMNSADQGVFPMDTAFKRRWDFKYFGINHNEELVSNIKVELNGQFISWNDLRKAINEELLSYRINEDKLLGPFFAFNEYLKTDIPVDEFKEIFKNKIIMYLFEDAARSKRNELFSGVAKNTNLTYSQICEAFDVIGVEIFCDNIKEKFINEDE